MSDLKMEMYEDMFKEITKKFYLDEEEGTNAQQFTETDFKTDGQTSMDLQNGYGSGQDILDDERWINSDETISWTTSKIAAYSSSQKLFRCTDCECIGFLSRIAEHWLGTHANLRVFQCGQCSYTSAWARCVRMHLARQHNICPDSQKEDAFQNCWKESPVLQEVTSYLQRLKAKVEGPADIKEEDFPEDSLQDQDNDQDCVTAGVDLCDAPLSPAKRYNCGKCNYSSDRKDLFARHETIHLEDKPFQCNVCHKQFNRADHIKKHFTRMHREFEYVLSNVRRLKDGAKRRKADPITPPQTNTFIPVTAVAAAQIASKAESNDAPHQSVIQLNQQLLALQQQHQEEVQQRQLLVDNPIPLPLPSVATVSTQSDLARKIESLLPPLPIKPSQPKKKYEPKFTRCEYCTWSGMDNWCLKRHMNTHLKPYVCSLCDYKAARSERLTTHAYKVHNKRACTRCTFMADDYNILSVHQVENHRGMRARRNRSLPPSPPVRDEKPLDSATSTNQL